MANELSIIELIGKVPGCPIRYTCADGNTIPKGSLVTLTDPRTVIVHAAANAPVVGVAAMEKVANDGSTEISIYTNGIWDITAAAAGATGVGAITAGSATANMFEPAAGADFLNGSVIGQALEEADNDERIAVRILK